MTRRFIIDTDTAGDDVTSLLIGLLHPESRLEAITVCAGNVPLPLCVRNALITVERAGRPDVPVFVGADRPLLCDLVTCEYVHGDDGMGNSNFPDAQVKPQAEAAASAIVRLVNQFPGEIEIMAQAPLTNIALAFMLDPTITAKVKRLWIMGGSNNFIGNVIPAAEFNFYVDPAAAKIVFDAGFNITMVGWEICVKHGYMPERDIEAVRQMETPLSRFYLDVNRAAYRFNREKGGIQGISHPDSIMMSMAIDNRVMTRSARYHVDVEHRSELTRGYSSVDVLGITGKAPNAEVCLAADYERFREMLFTILRSH